MALVEDRAARVLIDNSSLRILALRDPSGQETNRFLRNADITPIVTMFTLSEIFKGFVKQPSNLELHEELCRRCAFVLSIDDLLLLPDTVHCTWLEYFHNRGVDRLTNQHSEVKEALVVLQDCAKGFFQEAIQEKGRAYYAADEELYKAGLAIALSHESRVHLQSESVSIVTSPEYMAQVTETLLTNEATRRGARLDSAQLGKTVYLAANFPYRVPYLVGASRVQMWFHWRVANSPTKNIKPAFREDLKLLPYSLYAGTVLSQDGDYRKFGPEMFPEIRFNNLDDFLSS